MRVFLLERVTIVLGLANFGKKWIVLVLIGGLLIIGVIGISRGRSVERSQEFAKLDGLLETRASIREVGLALHGKWPVEKIWREKSRVIWKMERTELGPQVAQVHFLIFDGETGRLLDSPSYSVHGFLAGD